MKRFKTIAWTLVVACVIGSFYVVHFKVWRLKHPAAPTWTYFF